MRNKLQLRPLEKEDLEFIYQMRTNPDVMDYWFKEPYATMESLKKWYEAGQDSDLHRHFILYHLKEKIGYLALYNINNRHRNAEFAIMFDPLQQGKGYATKATRMIVDYGFNQLNLRKLYLFVDKSNEKAAHIYEKVGFQIEGEMKKHYFVKGSYHDAVFMSLFQEDYMRK
ncbi:GNAT family N-acetyltransferase [Oceanobacillus sp. CAU 1775]